MGYNFRQALVNTPQGSQTVIPPAPLPPIPITVPGQTDTPLGGYSTQQANGIDATSGKFDPHKLPILHGNPYAPSGQDGSDCQPGQTGYILGNLRIKGQAKSNPAVAVSDIPGSRGPTTLYYNQDGTRVSKDTRIPSHQPSGKIVNP